MVGTPFCFAPPAPPPTSAAETRAKAHKGRRRCALTMVAGTEGTTCAASGGSLVEAQLGAGVRVQVPLTPERLGRLSLLNGLRQRVSDAAMCEATTRLSVVREAGV